MSEPRFVHALTSGAEITDEPLVIIEDVEQQTREMELARAAAAVSCRNYLVYGSANPANRSS